MGLVIIMAKKKKKTTAEEIGRNIGKEIDKARREDKHKCTCKHKHMPLSCIYGLGFIGSLVYYISTATGFWMGVWGVIKALLWPAFLVYKLFGM